MNPSEIAESRSGSLRSGENARPFVSNRENTPQIIEFLRVSSSGEWVLRFCFDISGPFEIGLGIS